MCGAPLPLRGPAAGSWDRVPVGGVGGQHPITAIRGRVRSAAVSPGRKRRTRASSAQASKGPSEFLLQRSASSQLLRKFAEVGFISAEVRAVCSLLERRLGQATTTHGHPHAQLSVLPSPPRLPSQGSLLLLQERELPGP